MMRKLFLSLLLTMLCVVGMVANPVTQGQALQKARAFLQTRGITATANMSMVYQGRQASHQHGAPTKAPCYYVFNNGNDAGFVIVAGDDCAEDVLGYAESGSFDADNIPENMQAFLQGYAEEIAMARTQGLNNTGSEENVEVARQVIAPLVTAHWNQYDPYNQKCPLYGAGGNSGERCITGCVATALAQVMYYHKYPASSPSIPDYKSNDIIGKLAALPETDFDWNNMSNCYSINPGENEYETQESRDAVATLFRYCGQAVKMDYTPTGSGANTMLITSVLSNYFGYKNPASWVDRYNYTIAEWNDLIYHELQNARPVIYSASTSGGSGHAFVCDGFDGHEMFHINWGWGGLADGYYRLQALNPSSQGAGGSNGYGGYSLSQSAIIGISPTKVNNTDSEVSGEDNENGNVELTVKSVKQIAKKLDGPRQLRVFVHNNGSKEFNGRLYLLLDNSTIAAFEGAFVPANGDDFVDFLFPASAGSHNIAISTTQNQSDIIYSQLVTISDEWTYPLLTVTNTNLKNVAMVDGNLFQYGRLVEYEVTFKNESTIDYNNKLVKHMYVENPEGTFSGFSQAIDVSILAGEEKTILFTHELAMGDMYWIFISDDRKDQENESSWNYGYCEEYGYTVSPGVVYWKGTGERYAVAPTDEITVSEDVAAVSFEDIDNFTGVTITPNSNDNTIYYFAPNTTTPTSLIGKNVVKGYNSDKIALSKKDGFYIPQSFTASKISFSYVPTLGADGKNGWQTITLPFAVQKVTSGGNEVDWYHGNDTSEEKDFWLREFKQVAGNVVQFADVAEWIPNVPYLIAVPGDRWGAEYDMTNKLLEFSASNVRVEPTTVSAAVSDNYEFVGVTGNTTIDSEVYVLNEKGSSFVKKEGATLNGCSAYFTINNPTIETPAYLNIGFFDTTGICMPHVTADDGQMVDVYAIDGVKVATVSVNGGKVDLNRLPKGIYIVEGKKIVR